MKIILSWIYLIIVCVGMHFSIQAKADTRLEVEAYKISGTEIRLVHFPSLHLLVSSHCVKKMNDHWGPNENCEALKKLKLASLKTKGVQGALSGGVNPGSVVCAKLGGKSLVALDSKSNQNSVCRLSDGSIISSGTLHFHARKNDKM